jgi:hypothetical protein
MVFAILIFQLISFITFWKPELNVDLFGALGFFERGLPLEVDFGHLF